MKQQNKDQFQERFIQDNLLFTNDHVAGYTLIDDEVRSGFRRLFSSLGAVFGRRRSKAQRQVEGRPAQRQAASRV